MFDITVTDKQIEYAEEMVKKFNFGQRGYGDGNKKEQLTGIIGQTVFSDEIKAARPTGATGFDGGKDFIINGKKIDIKTMTRSVPMRSYFVHNFIGYQKNYEVDYYIFASFNTTNKKLTICGIIDKENFFEKSTFFAKGSIRKRSDGTTFETFAPLYEIKQTALVSLNNIQEIIDFIK